MTKHFAEFADGAVTLLQGDCVEWLERLPAASVDAVVTDPPYNISFMAKPWDAYTGREDAGFAYWLSGLIDGEGHFAIKAHTRGTHAPAFTLKLRADERGTLQMIARRLGVGSLVDEPRPDGNPLVKWVVQDKEGCQRLVDLLDKYPLRAKKLADFWTWREAVCEWTARPRGNRWTGAADNTRMAELRERLMSGRAYSGVPWSGHEFQDWCRLWASECLRVLKPGGHLMAFGGARTGHRLAAAVEDAGFEIRDSIAWLYAQGFPKSLDLGDGWGTALKPAFEPIVVGRKPLAYGTVTENVRVHGTGGLHVDAGRLDTVSEGPGTTPPSSTGGARTVTGTRERTEYDGGRGRWPTNVAIDGDVAELLDREAGTRSSGANPERRGSDKFRDAYGDFKGQAECEPARGANSGGASRFFPVFRFESKAGDSERPAYWRASCQCPDAWPTPMRSPARATDATTAPGSSSTSRSGSESTEPSPRATSSSSSAPPTGTSGLKDGRSTDAADRVTLAAWSSRSACGVCGEPARREVHATVKPLALMRWLVRLTCPAGGLVLDPFGGSGTTGEACVIEGMRAVLIEREPAYWSLIEQRLTKPIELDLFSSVPAPTGRTGEPSADRRYGDSGATPFTMTPGPRYDRPARTPEPTTALFD